MTIRSNPFHDSSNIPFTTEPNHAEKNNQDNILVKDIKVTLYPEILAAANKAKVLDLYVAWAVAKALDKHNSKSGVISVDTLRRLMNYVLPIGEVRTYHKVQQGIGRFWNKPGGKNGARKLGLWSLSRILNSGKMDINIAPVSPRCVTVEQLRDNSENGNADFRSFLMGIVRSRHEGMKESHTNFANMVGISTRTTKRQISLCTGLNVIQNWIVVLDFADRLSAVNCQLLMNKTLGKIKPFRVASNGKGGYSVVRQLPNTYLLSDVSKLAIKKRPRELSKYDTDNLLKLPNRRYVFDKQSERSVKKSISAGTVSTDDLILADGQNYLCANGYDDSTAKISLWRCKKMMFKQGETIKEYLERNLLIAPVDSNIQ